jgi:soluble lytic murein transglycosylase-like protein
MLPASQYQSVNPYVLRAILAVESNLNPTAIGRNTNGTVDVGMGQTNSIHFNDLAKYGIAPQHLADPCISTYVAAWQVRKLIAKHGNTWEAIARYHSATPAHNQRYQILLRNHLVKASILPGPLQAIPNSNRGVEPSTWRSSAGENVTFTAPIGVFDQPN